MSRDNPLWGRTTYPPRIADAWARSGRIDRRQVHGTIPATDLAGLEDLPAQSCCGNCLARSVGGPHDLLQAALWPSDPAPRGATKTLCDCPSHLRTGGANVT